MRNVGVIGSGAAGLMAAIAASENAEVTLITDGSVGKSNTAMAQGGLQCPEDSRESLKSFRSDIVRSADTAIDVERIDNFVSSVRETVLLLEALGLEYDRDQSGAWCRGRAGGLSEDRIISVKDQIGPALVKILRDTVKKRQITIQAQSRVTGIVPTEGRLKVAIETPEPTQIEFDALVVCTGGISYETARLRAEVTTNPPNSNNGMVRTLRRLGLPEIHQEFFQYQPFGMVVPTLKEFGKAIPERIVSYPIRILDRHSRPIIEDGELPDRRKLTNRMNDLEKQGAAFEIDGGKRAFRLVFDELPPEVMGANFPKALRYLKTHGFTEGWCYIRPFLHYHLGGFEVDASCRTRIPGLFLAGEITGGLHGKNRLMGNGLTDSLVHGRVAGFEAARYAADPPTGLNKKGINPS